MFFVRRDDPDLRVQSEQGRKGLRDPLALTFENTAPLPRAGHVQSRAPALDLLFPALVYPQAHLGLDTLQGFVLPRRKLDLVRRFLEIQEQRRRPKCDVFAHCRLRTSA